MKKILLSLMLSFIVLGIFIPTVTVHAVGESAAGLVPESTATTIRNAVDAGTRTNVTAGAGAAAGSFVGSNVIDWVSGVLSFVAYTVLWLMSWLLWAAGSLLNLVLDQTVVKMKEGIDAMTGIAIAWKVVRDLMNIALIFLLVYEGIKMILGMASSAKSLITGIILASVLINFSLFFTKVIIDASNIVTIGFYNSILSAADSAQVNQNTLDSGLSGAFAQTVGATSIFNADSFTNFKSGPGGDNRSLLIIGIGGSIILLILSFVFFAISMMFIIRYVTLIVLLMLSPVGYMGLALPSMKGYAKQWWETLSGQCLFAPAYMIMTWVILTLMSSPGFFTLRGNASWTVLFNGVKGVASPSSLGLLLNFALVIGFIIASLTTARGLAKKGTGELATYTKQLTSFAGGAILGGAANLSRQTLGRAGNSLAENEWLKEKAQTSSVARAALQVTNRAAGSTFDVRATKIGGMLNKNIADLGKVDPKKTNYRASINAKANSAEELAKLLKPSDDAVERAKAQRALITPEAKEKEKEQVRKAAAEAEQTYNDALTKLSAENRELGALLTEQYDPAITPKRKMEIQAQINGMSGPAKARANEINSLRATLDKRQQSVKEIKDHGSKWLSDEEKRLIAIAGGQEEKTKDNKITQVGVESAYAQRANVFASTKEQQSPLWRWTKNIAKFGFIPVSSTTLTSSKENRVIARKIRGAAKAKKPKDEIKDLLSKLDEEEKKNKGDDEGKEGKEGAPKETTPPPAA